MVIQKTGDGNGGSAEEGTAFFERMNDGMEWNGMKKKHEEAEVNHNRYPKIAIISDLTGFGRCALAEQIPVISHFGIQCCSVPTAILSNHSAYESFYAKDFTKELGNYLAEWDKLGLLFDGVLTGFCGSLEQMDGMLHFIQHFTKEDAAIIVDPIMGDHGRKYTSISDDVCERMEELVFLADVITPNWTELCMLTGAGYEVCPTRERIGALCEKLMCRMKKDAKIVVTGVQRGSWIENYIFEQNKGFKVVKKRLARENRCGTGDLFSAIVAAGVLSGMELETSVKKAADFIGRCIEASDQLGIPKTDGVCFERFLKKL